MSKNHATGALKADFFLTKGDEFLFQRFLIGVIIRCRQFHKGAGVSPHLSFGMATTAANDTRGCLVMTFSTSTDEMFSPPEIIMSLARSLTCRYWSGCMTAKSPDLNHSPKNIFSRLRVFQITAHQRVAAHNDFTHCFAICGQFIHVAVYNRPIL